MDKSTLQRSVAKTRPKPEMTVILRNTPPTYHWNWFSREDTRMHLQAVDRVHAHAHYKIWLENKGRRVIEPEPGIPAKVLKTLTAEIMERRARIEAEWAAFMIRKGWLTVRLSGGVIALYAYPESPNHFKRTIELREIIPNEAIAKKLSPKDVALSEELACLELFPQRREGAREHLPLNEILWVD